MPKRRGGQNSEKARKATAEPDAEHSGSEDEPMAEPPMPTPYVRLRDTETQTDAKTQKRKPRGGRIPGYHPRNEKDRVMLSRAAMHKHQILLQCAQCKAGTLTDVIVVVALCAPLPCKSCGYTLMRPAGQTDKAAALAYEDQGRSVRQTKGQDCQG